MGLLYDDEWTPEAKKFYNSLGGSQLRQNRVELYTDPSMMYLTPEDSLREAQGVAEDCLVPYRLAPRSHTSLYPVTP